MKKFFLIFTVLVISLMFFNCEEESLFTNNSESQPLEQSNKIKPTVTVTASLHRGKKWSNNHNVTPCTTSFGLCNISVSVSFEYDKAKLQEIDSTTIRISFLKDVGANQGDVFISDEDDYFDFPNDVSTALGYKTVTITPKNYVTNFSPEYPYGYVDLTFVGTK